MAGELPVVGKVDFPLYVVSDEESGGVLVAAEGVEGFFVDPEAESPEVAFLRVHEVEKGRRRVEDAVMAVMNRQREKIGEYFIGRAVLGDLGVGEPGGNILRVAFRFFGNRCEYPEAERIWPRWASGVALEKGEWVRWPANYQGAWLHVVQNSWFASNRRAARYGVEDVVHLDGGQISTKPGSTVHWARRSMARAGTLDRILTLSRTVFLRVSARGPRRGLFGGTFRRLKNPLIMLSWSRLWD